MNYLEQIFTIIISSLIGASSSAIITILMNRRDDINSLYKIFYSIYIWGLILLILIILLIIILIFFERKKLPQ